MNTLGIIISAIVLFVIITVEVLVIIIKCNSIDKDNKEIIWGDKKRTLFGFPISTTGYSLTNERIIIKTGLFNKSEDEIRLYRILDIKLTRSFWQRIFGLGTIHFVSSDKTSKNFSIGSIKNSEEAKELFSKSIEEQRDKKRVVSREFMVSDDDFEDDDDEIDDEN